VPVHFLPARVALVTSLTFICACSRPAVNLVADSDMRDIAAFWTLQGRAEVRPGLGPDGHAMLYVPGNGGPLGFRSAASFLASVQPGQTYTLSAYLDATGDQGTPPFVVLDAIDGSWTGVSVDQPGKGVVTKTFSVPANSGTTLIRGTFNPENGIYPVGRGPEFSQPQIETGAVAHAYVAGDGGELGRPPPGGNLVVDSDLRDKAGYWELTGRMRLMRTSEFNGAPFVEFVGDGRPSGFGDTASFLAAVTPGTTYTFSMYLDGSAHKSTPPYVFLLAVDGMWKGTQLYQMGRGRAFVTFSIPSDSGTTMIRIMTSPQNGVYRSGATFEAAEPQLAAEAYPSAYEPSSTNVLRAPPEGNLIFDSDMRDADRTWKLFGRMRLEANGPGGRSAIAYVGDGHPSGYDNRAAFYARVTPGRTYTFSAFVDGSAHSGTPPYVFLRAVDGTWAGAQVYQPGVGRIYQTFTVPTNSRTTCVEGWVTPQNGTYALGTRMTFLELQISEGAVPARYVAGPKRGGCG
jgi:hypothetical protein